MSENTKKSNFLIIFVVLLICIIISIIVYIKIEKPYILDSPSEIPNLFTSSSQPVIIQSSSQPVINQSSSQPVIKQSSSQPVIKQSSSQPVIKQSNLQPVQSSSQPVQSNLQPVQSSSQPVMIQSSLQPIMIQSKDKQFVINTEKIDTTKNVALIVGSIITGIIIEETIEAIIKNGLKGTVEILGKSMTKTLAKLNIRTFLKTASKLGSEAKIALKSMMKLGEKAGEKAAIKAGEEVAEKLAEKAAIEVGETVAEKTAIVVAEKAAIAGTKAGGEAGATIGTAFTMGPVGIALLVFDLASLILDSADAGGYNILDKWKIIVDAVKGQINKMLENTNIQYPLTTGPLDVLYLQDAPTSSQPTSSQPTSSQEKLSSEPLNADDMDNLEKLTLYVYLLKREISNLVKSDTSLKTIISSSLTDEITYISKNYFTLLPASELTNENLNKLIKLFISDKESFYNTMYKYIGPEKSVELLQYKQSMESQLQMGIQSVLSINIDLYTQKANENLCKQYGGIIIDDGKCMYTKENCVNNKDNDYNIDKAWSNKDQRCYVKNNIIADLCDQNNLQYDIEKGICIITEDMCRTKGGDPIKNSDGTIDCRINDAQNFFELVFGSTVVRGLKQIFDPEQYEKCKDGYTDDGYTCRKKCSDGYNDVGGVCWAKTGEARKNNCEPGYNDSGATCDAKAVTVGAGIPPELTKDCPDGREMKGGLCYEKCKDGYKSNGATICYYDDDRMSYIQPSWGCDPHYDDWGGTKTCNAKLAFKNGEDTAIPPNDCKPGWKLVGTTCIKEPDDPDYEIRAGDIISYWYKGGEPLSYGAKEAIQENPCDDLEGVVKGVGSCTGTEPKKCDTCNSVCGNDHATCVPNSTCTTKRTCSGCGCIKGGVKRSCTKKDALGTCWAWKTSCPSGQRDDGTSCWEDYKCTGGAIRQLNCTGGGVVTREAKRTCPDGYEFDGLKALCYPKECRDGFKLIAGVCWRQKPDSILIPESNKEKARCNSNRENIDGLCYLKCPKDLDASGNDLGTGYVRTGLLCLPPKGQSYTKDKAPCSDGFHANAGICYRNEYDRGAGKPPYDCKSNRKLIGGLCYEKCEDKNTNDIKYHHLNGAPTQCVPEKGLNYPKVVYSYVPETYAKKRSVPYSTVQQYVKR